MEHHIFFASNPNSSPTAIGRLCLAMNIVNAISDDVTLSISQPATNLLMLPKRDWAFAMCASYPLYVTLHIVSSRQLVILPIPKCVLHATQYAFVALWLLARIPGDVLAHSLSVLAFLVKYPIRHVHNAIFANRPKPRCRALAKITNWEDNQLSGRRLVSPTCRA